jgi:hypothetical protein
MGGAAKHTKASGSKKGRRDSRLKPCSYAAPRTNIASLPAPGNAMNAPKPYNKAKILPKPPSTAGRSRRQAR